MKLLDFEFLNRLSPSEFRAAEPYPWINPEGALREEGFAALYEQMPDISMFKRRFGEKRRFGQQSHDRYALEYEEKLKLPDPWTDFIAELRGNEYQDWLINMLGVSRIHLSFHWHYIPSGCSVSPHCDALRKLGSHIFYFHTEKDWDASWGGETLILDDHGKIPRESAPAFEDFPASYTAATMGNRSLLFARRGQSWHGVKPVRCPEDRMRRVFIVVINKNSPMARLKRAIGLEPRGY